MKTKNVFTLTSDSVEMKVMDVTNPDEHKELAKHEFDVTAIPVILEDGEQASKSLAAYGLSRLMQDRCSDFTDSKLGDVCATAAEVAKARLEAYQAVFDTLAGGQFRARRATSKAGASVDAFFASGFAAFCKANGKDVTPEQATVILQGMSGEQRKALRADDRIKPFIAEAREAARTAVDGLDLESLLG
jgi:orotidine-5'-phosphate decarboxylase